MNRLASIPDNEIENPRKKKRETQSGEKPQLKHQPVLNPMTTEFEDEFWPLSGKPYFDVVLTKAHVKPAFNMAVPVKLYQLLPSAAVPAVITYCGQNWRTVYHGDRSQKRFDISWKAFVIDNDLKMGDALVFELIECSRVKLKFRVQILRGDFPAELMAGVHGETSDNPIFIQ
ncbi:unnamed protein product [Ilex paraguariensis]